MMFADLFYFFSGHISLSLHLSRSSLESPKLNAKNEIIWSMEMDIKFFDWHSFQSSFFNFSNKNYFNTITFCTHCHSSTSFLSQSIVMKISKANSIRMHFFRLVFFFCVWSACMCQCCFCKRNIFERRCLSAFRLIDRNENITFCIVCY